MTFRRLALILAFSTVMAGIWGPLDLATGHLLVGTFWSAVLAFDLVSWVRWVQLLARARRAQQT
jgi:hypothetical protein